MKILLKELVEAKEGLSKILGVSQDIKLSYRVRKIAGKVLSELKHIEEMRQDLVKKYGEEQEDGSYNVVKNLDKFRIEWKSFLETEIELDVQIIPFECFESVKLSAFDIALLEKFIEEPKLDKPKRKDGKA